jgi:hypothetical protein
MNMSVNVRGMGSRRWWLNLAGAASVLAVLLAVVLLLPALNRAVPLSRGNVATKRHDVAAGVSVLPPVGGLIAKTTHSGEESGSVLFLVGPAVYVVSVQPYDGDLAGATVQLKIKIQGMRGYQVTSGDVPLVTRSGIPGVGGSFTAPGRLGRFAAFRVPGHAIEVTVNGSDGDLAQALQRIDESIASITYEGGE